MWEKDKMLAANYVYGPSKFRKHFTDEKLYVARNDDLCPLIW